MQSAQIPVDNRFSRAGQQVLAPNSPQDYLADALNFVRNSNIGSAPLNRQALERENYMRGKSTLNNPAQIQNILNQTDFQGVKNMQPNTYKNYMNNVTRQDDLMKKMKEANGGMLLKEMSLRKQQDDIKNLGQLNKYNNDMAQLAYKSQRNAIQNYKAGTTGEDDVFLNFLKDPTLFPANQNQKNQGFEQQPQQNTFDDLSALNKLSQGLINPQGPVSGNDPMHRISQGLIHQQNDPINELIAPQEQQNHKEADEIREPFSSSLAHLNPRSSDLMSSLPHLEHHSAALRQKDSIQSPYYYKKPSIVSPNLENLSHSIKKPSIMPPNLQNIGPPSYQIPAQSFQYQPNYQQPPPIVNVIPMPYPPEKRSSHSSREKNTKIPEEVKIMLTKQNELLQNFIDKVERNGTLETKEDVTEKYEHKIRELEKNFDLSQEILNLKKQLYAFNSDKGKEEKKPALPPPNIFMGMNNPMQNFMQQTMSSPQMQMNPWNPYQNNYNYNPYYPYQTNPWMTGMQNQNPAYMGQPQPYQRPMQKKPDKKSNFEKLLIKLLGDENQQNSPGVRSLSKKNTKINMMHDSLDLQKKKKANNNNNNNNEDQGQDVQDDDGDEDDDALGLPPKLKQSIPKNEKISKERRKYTRKWFRYVAFLYIWKKSVDDKIVQRKINFMHTFEDNIQDILNKANDWTVKISRGMSPLLDKNKTKNYDLNNIKNIFQNNKKEAGKLFSEIKNVINWIFNDMIDGTTVGKLDEKVISFLGGICQERSFLPDYFIFQFEYDRMDFSEYYGFLRAVDPMQMKMIMAFFLIIKVYMGNTFINPWRVKPNFPKHPFFLDKIERFKYFEQNLPPSHFDDFKIKEPLKLKLLDKVIMKEYGFNFQTNKERSLQESASKVMDNIFIDGIYKFSDYEWIVEKEKKWFDEKLQQVGIWAEKAYLLVHQNYKKTKTFF